VKIVETDLPEVFIVEPKAFSDDRGFFFESYNKKDLFQEAKISSEFVQDNHSKSCQGTLRGLHYQVKQPQGKLVRVTSGTVFDVAVDIRKRSLNFGKWVGVELSSENKRQLWIPPGFAHGFLTISDDAEVQYKTTDYWAQEYERTIIWNDASLGILWPISGEPILSGKDACGVSMASAEVYEDLL